MPQGLLSFGFFGLQIACGWQLVKASGSICASPIHKRREPQANGTACFEPCQVARVKDCDDCPAGTAGFWGRPGSRGKYTGAVTGHSVAALIPNPMAHGQG